MKKDQKYQPSREVVERAKARVLRLLEQEGGAIEMGSPDDIEMLHRNLRQPHGLGDRRDHQLLTVAQALRELMAEGPVAWDASVRMLGVTYCFEGQKKSKFSVRREGRRWLRSQYVS